MSQFVRFLFAPGTWEWLALAVALLVLANFVLGVINYLNIRATGALVTETKNLVPTTERSAKAVEGVPPAASRRTYAEWYQWARLTLDLTVDEANRAGLAGAEAISAGADLESAETWAIAAAGDIKPPLRGLALFWAVSSRPPEARLARLAYRVIRLLAILLLLAEILRIAFLIFGRSIEASPLGY